MSLCLAARSAAGPVQASGEDKIHISRPDPTSGYDLLDPLTQVQAQKSATRWEMEEAYTYDAVGNRLTDKAQCSAHHPSRQPALGLNGCFDG